MAKKENKNLHLAAWFIFVICFFILISALIKIFFLVSESKFDGKHKFVLEFSSQNRSSLVSFSPQNKSIYIVNLKSKLSEKSIIKLLEVPVNAYINDKNDVSDKNLGLVLFSSLFKNSENKDLNFYDNLRLLLFSRSVPLSAIYVKDYSPDLSSDQLLTLISLAFSDQDISKENLSIQIINATSASGAGSRLAKLIDNIGGNVILVQSLENSKSKSEIKSSKKSYTVNFLKDYLNIPLNNKSSGSIADVIIVIGTDIVDSGKF